MAFLRRKTKRKLKLFFNLTLIGLVLFGYAYFIEPNFLKTKERIIKLGCLKEDLKDKKFIQLSDFHFTRETKKDKIDQIYKAVLKEEPAAVFLTGDYTSEKEGLPAVKELVGKISAKFPVYAVFGNWDYDVYFRNMGEIQSALENSGAKVLINDAVQLKVDNEKINLLGVKDPYNSKRMDEDIDEALKDVKKINNSSTKSSASKAVASKSGDSSCNILLAHSPDIVKAAEEKNMDLVLVGHTHGGQIYIPYLAEYIMPVKSEGKGFVSGLYKVNDMQMYVNQGIGMSTFPLRFGVPPEMTVITLSRP